MPNAKDAATNSENAKHRILVLGGAGSGKTTQLHTLPGRKFAYLFDPNALRSIEGLDIDYEQFLPDALELDATLKGFNKGSKSDKPASDREPTVYMRWVDDLNNKAQAGFFDNVDWLGVDSLSLLANAVMDRQMWLNNRYGGIEDLGDYRIVGSKIADVFRSICSLPVNLYCTGHLNSFQDEKTKRIEVSINLPGKARNMLPLLFSNIWELRPDEKLGYVCLTKPESRGFQGIRTTIRGLQPIEDMRIKDFSRAQESGIGALLRKHDTQTSNLIRANAATAAKALAVQTPPSNDVQRASASPQ